MHALRSNVLLLPSYRYKEHCTHAYFLFLRECSKDLKISMTEEERIFSSNLRSYLGKKFLRGDVLSTDTARMLPKVSLSFFSSSACCKAKEMFLPN